MFASLNLSRSESLAANQLLATLRSLSRYPFKSDFVVSPQNVGVVEKGFETLIAIQRNISAALDSPDLDLGEYFGEIVALFTSLVDVSRHMGSLDDAVELSEWTAAMQRADAYAGAIISVKTTPNISAMYINRRGQISFADVPPPGILVAASARGVKRAQPEPIVADVQAAVERVDAAAEEVIVANVEEIARAAAREEIALARERLRAETESANRPEGSAFQRLVGSWTLRIAFTIATSSIAALEYAIANRGTVGFVANVARGFEEVRSGTLLRSLFTEMPAPTWYETWLTGVGGQLGLVPQMYENLRNSLLGIVGRTFGVGFGIGLELTTQYIDVLQRAASSQSARDIAIAGAVTSTLAVLFYSIAVATRIEIRNRLRR